MSELNMEDPEIRKAIEDAAERLFNEKAEALRAKNLEIVEEKQRANTRVESLQKELDELSDYRRKSEAEKLAEQGKYNDALKLERETYSKQKAAYEERQAKQNAVIEELVVNRGLSEALIAAGVNQPTLLRAATAIWRDQVKLEYDDSGSPLAKVNGEPLKDVIEGWKTTDDAKFFISAPANSGGGTTGGKPLPISKKRSEMTAEEKSQFIKEHSLADFQKLPS